MTRLEIVLVLALLSAITACSIVLWVRTNRAQRYLKESYPDLGTAPGLGIPLVGSLLLRRALRKADHPATRDAAYLELQRGVWQAWVAERVLIVVGIGLGFYGAYAGV